MAFDVSATKVGDEMGQSEGSGSKLSRQRRYLIFPTGSSVQLGNHIPLLIQSESILSLKKVSVNFKCLFLLFVAVYEFGVSIPDYTFYLTTGITVALAWNLPDKPTIPEHKYDDRVQIHRLDGNDTTASGTINNNSTFLKPNENDIVNRIANYAKYYFQNRRRDSYYFGRNPLFDLNQSERKRPCNNKNSSCSNRGYPNYYYSSNYGNDIRKGISIRPPHSPSTFFPAKPSTNANYMIARYFKPWIESKLSQVKPPKMPSKLT